MAAPAATARGTPAGIWIPDGFRTKYTFELNPTVSLWEVTVKGAGVEGGEPIPQDSMWNVAWRIKRARQLKELTPATITFLYDPNLKSQIQSLVNIETVCTETFYDGTTFAYFAFLKSVEFEPLAEGEAGKGTAIIVPTNYDKSDHTEQAPVIVNKAGT